MATEDNEELKIIKHYIDDDWPKNINKVSTN